MGYYPLKYRKRRVGYRNEGHSLIATSKVFKVCITAIYKWGKKLRNDGNFKNNSERYSVQLKSKIRKILKKTQIFREAFCETFRAS